MSQKCFISHIFLHTQKKQVLGINHRSSRLGLVRKIIHHILVQIKMSLFITTALFILPHSASSLSDINVCSTPWAKPARTNLKGLMLISMTVSSYWVYGFWNVLISPCWFHFQKLLSTVACYKSEASISIACQWVRLHSFGTRGHWLDPVCSGCAGLNF